MAQKDIVEKTLESYADVFADIVNVLLFHGETVVTPESLEDTGAISQYKAENKIHEQERDTVKLWKDKNIAFALIGFENQTKSEKDMPFRVLGYDGAAYRSQLLNKKNKSRYPVITIVLYFGKGHWNQPKSIGKLVSLPDGLDRYFNDYKINVFEISWLSDEQVDMFKSDFRVVADYFTQMRKNNSYNPSPQTLVHVDEVLKLLGIFGEDARFIEKFSTSERKKVNNMCEWLDMVETKSREEGRIEGRIQEAVEAAVEYNSSEKDTIARLMKKFDLSEEEAKKYYDMYSPQTV